MTLPSARVRRRQTVASFLALLLPLVPAARLQAAADAAGSLESAVKATFLLKFPAFVTWRDPLPAAAFNVCVVGRNPFSGLLRKAADNQTVEHRPVRCTCSPP